MLVFLVVSVTAVATSAAPRNGGGRDGGFDHGHGGFGGGWGSGVGWGGPFGFYLHTPTTQHLVVPVDLMDASVLLTTHTLCRLS